VKVGLGPTLPPGKAHDQMTRIVGKLAPRLTPEELMTTSVALNGGRLPEEEIRSIVESIATKVHGGATRLGSLSREHSRALIEAHPPTWRVRGIVASDDYGVLAGPKGVGKTFALLDLAVGVALGEPWFGRFPTEQAHALVLTSEDSRARLWQRADAIARSLGRDSGELEGRLFIHPQVFSAVTDLDLLRAELEAVGRVSWCSILPTATWAASAPSCSTWAPCSRRCRRSASGAPPRARGRPRSDPAAAARRRGAGSPRA
jgi:hypothetical protein